MDFRGHLRLPKDAGTGIPVVLRVDDIYVVITTDGEELGSWRADEMLVERIFSNQFSLDLAGEPMVFLAADALGFAYEGVTAIEELQARLTKRRVFKKKKAVSKTATEQPEIPEEVPSAVVEPQPLWTPPAPKPATEPGDEQRVVPADPQRPVQRRLDREEAPPTDSRVVYPSAKSVEPERVVEPEPETVVEPVVAPEPEPEVVPEPVAQSPVTAEPEPVFEMELEVEEVGLASSGGSWIEPESVLTGLESEPESEPEVDPDSKLEPEPEIAPIPEVEIPAAEDDVLEIEDLEPAAAAFVESFVVPADEAAGVLSEDAVQEAVEVPEAEMQPESAEPDLDPVVEPVAEAEPVPQAAASDPEPQISEPSEVDALNGHREKPSPKPAQKSSLFRRDKKPTPHDHVYGEPKTIGGLKRSVCDICGHVTFSGEDVYQGW